MPAFQRALERGADAIECDVRLTRDGMPVISNAISFAGSPSLRGPIAAYTLDALRTNARYAIPTLADVLERFCGQIGLEIHLKVEDPLSLAAVAQVLQPYEGLWKSCEITSYDPVVLDVMGRRCPGLATDLLLPLSENWMLPRDIAFLAIHRADTARSRGKHHRQRRVQAIHLHPTQLLSETVAAIRAAGYEVHAWDVNDADALDKVTALGILRICTDRLADALSYHDRQRAS